MFEKLLAKSATKTSAAQTIIEHTNHLINRWETFREIYPNALSKKDWDILLQAVKYHDLGKANTKFQNKVRTMEEHIVDLFPEIDEIPHNYLSCAFMPIKNLITQYGKEDAKILILAVYYHHERAEQNMYESGDEIKKDLQKYVPLLMVILIFVRNLNLIIENLPIENFLETVSIFINSSE